MTSPLSPESVAQMVADREAGTPGPWRMRVNKRDDQDTCDVSICGDIFVLADLNGPQYAHQRANARRIARLPDLEAAYLTLAAENATLRDQMENASQAMSEVQPSWEYRCHAIMAALQLDFGGPTPDIPEEHTWYARNLRMANQRADKAENEARSLRASEAAALGRVKVLTKAMNGCVAAIEHADMSDGVCCCGDNMEGHSEPMNCGHSPVDMGEYHAHQVLIAARQALTPTAEPTEYERKVAQMKEDFPNGI